MENNLPKKIILRKKIEFNILINKGKTINVFPFYLKYYYFPSDKPSLKIAFTVKKKNFKRAVKRNYLKRLLKEAS